MIDRLKEGKRMRLKEKKGERKVAIKREGARGCRWTNYWLRSSYTLQWKSSDIWMTAASL